MLLGCNLSTLRVGGFLERTGLARKSETRNYRRTKDAKEDCGTSQMVRRGKRRYQITASRDGKQY